MDFPINSRSEHGRFEEHDRIGLFMMYRACCAPWLFVCCPVLSSLRSAYGLVDSALYDIPLWRFLANKGCRLYLRFVRHVLSVDHRGHGSMQSPKDRPYRSAKNHVRKVNMTDLAVLAQISALRA